MKKEYRGLLNIALPAMAENLLQMLMGAADSYLVAFLGLVALSGVAVATNIMAIYQAIFMALAAAISSRLAYKVGQGKDENLLRSTMEALKLTLLLGLVLGGVSLFFGSTVFAVLGTEKAVAQAGSHYLSLVGGGVVLLGLMTSMSAILRATGQLKLPMYISLFSNVLNLFFSALGVFVFDWGIAGVAWGTLLARLIACLILWSRLRLPLSAFTWTLDKKLLQLALPSTGERLMMRGGDVVVVSLVTSLGTAVLAGNAIGETLTQFNYMPVLGIATATVILTAQSQGNALQIERIRKASLVLAFVLMFAVAGLTFVFSPILLNQFTQDSLARQAGMVVVLSSLVGVPFTAATLVYTAFWQGLGNPSLPFYATSLGMWLVRIFLSYLLLRYTDLGLVSIWIGTILDNFFRAVFLIVAYKKHKRY